MIVTTTVTRSFLPGARVLARTHRETHPDATTYVLVIDGDPVAPEPDLVVLRPADLPLDPALFRRMATYYSVTELATALKPWLFRALLERHETVVFVDPDIAFFADCSDVADLAAAHGLVVNPHALAPMPDDGQRPTEADLSQAGSFNTGLVACSRAAGPFLDWWAARHVRECRVDHAAGLYVDQRWIDLAVHYFPHTVLRDPACNVAYWNLHERPLSRAGDGWLVRGEPLRFFHFSGMKRAKEMLTTYFGEGLRSFPESEPALSELLGWYRDRLAEADADDVSTTPYAYARSVDGVELTPNLRRWYREALDAGQSPPDALTPGFAGWAAAETARQQRLRARAEWDRQRGRFRSLARTVSAQAKDAGRRRRTGPPTGSA